MAAVKSTYSLDHGTIRNIQRLARAWQVSKSEVLRRTVRETTQREFPMPWKERLALFRSLGQKMRARGVDFDKWQKELRQLRW